MMTNNLARCRVEGRNIIEQLVPIGMPAETVDCDGIASYIDHQGLSAIRKRDLRMALLQASAKCSRGLVSDKTQSVARLGCPVLEVLDNRPSCHHPAGRQHDAWTWVEKDTLSLLSRIDLLEPRRVERILCTTLEHLASQISIKEIRMA